MQDNTLQPLDRAKKSVECNGFVFEEHYVATDDGYFLTMFRIIHKGYEEWKKQNIGD